MQRHIYIDPSYDRFNSDRLFDLGDPVLNRDGQLLPFQRLRAQMAIRNVAVSTADHLATADGQASSHADYYSLGIINNFERIKSSASARLAAFVIMEPPVVAPELYSALPRLTEVFEQVYVHNTHGDGYSLDSVDATRLRKLYWPIPHADVLDPYWHHQDRLRRVVVINGNHRPLVRSREQYSLRIDAMAELARLDSVDLYGTGWHRWWSRSALWTPYWRHVVALRSIYKGTCPSKFEVLQRYEFCLCFENMWMDGYITEKIFDCFYSGAIPLYVGAPNIAEYIPSDAFVDARKYASWTHMWEDINSMSSQRIAEMRTAGRDFLRSDAAQQFYSSIQNICEE